MLRIPILLSILFLCSQLISQSTENKIKPNIQVEVDGLNYQFSAELPPLVQLPGAPRSPFYEYFWEFGDGHFSTLESPKHIYRTGSPKEVRLYVTNNYAQGQTQVGSKIILPQFAPGAPDPVNELTGKLHIFNHQDPVPNDELVIALRYHNRYAQAMSGHVLLLYNETESKYNQFQPIGQPRLHHGESDLSSITPMSQFTHLFTLFPQWFSDVQNSSLAYRNHKLWRFSNLDANTSHNLFQSFIPQTAILADTNRMVSMTAYFIPKNRAEGVEKVTLEMTIRKSHDPNKMGVKPRLASFRNIENKTFKYRVDFQNFGDGPATDIKIETVLPTGMKRSSLRISDYSPECPICSETLFNSCLDTMFLGNKLIFTFKGIGLAGLNSSDILKKKQSKGYIEYSLAPRDEIQKKAIKSQTVIYMDQNSPVTTNKVKTKFKLGTSIGVRGGYAYTPDRSSDSHAFLGIDLTPYKARGIYPILGFTSGINTKRSGIDLKQEVELYENLEFNNQPVTSCLNQAQMLTPCYKKITDFTIDYEQTFLTFDLTVGARADPFPWLTIGGGMQYTFQLLDRQESVTEETKEYIVVQGNNGYFFDPFIDYSDDGYNQSINTTRKLPAIFGEVGLGQVQQGFSLGSRYLYSLSDNRTDYWQFFLQYRF